MDNLNDMAIKNMCEVYTLKIPENLKHKCLWAKIMIDENAWMFSCISDCGNFSYRWPSESHITFKKFLTQIDTGYLLRKIEPFPTKFNQEATFKNLVRALIEQRREGNITKEQAREDMNVIKEFEFDGSEDLLMERLLYHTKTFSGDYEWTANLMVKEHTPGAITFVKDIFPLLQEVLKIEVASL